jgi:hypothetical protein
MENKIWDILENVRQGYITVNEGTQQVLDLFAVSCRLFTIKYHSSYAVFDKREVIIKAKDENEALDKFWNGKNKEGWEVTSVSLNGN